MAEGPGQGGGDRPEPTTGYWTRAKKIFQEALESPAAQREAFLDRACGGDDGLRREVESLIEAHERAEGFLETPPAGAAARLLEAHDRPEPEERAGQRLGAYRIERRIGQGGAGSVYLAVRADRQFQRQVAIKVLRRGVVTEETLRRFRAEREILASIEHPNIAGLLDAGTTPDGLPYLVMEYVEGAPVDRYCDERRLGIRERLRLFDTVCAAVQVAHQSLVVHRDLKPGNILVTADGTPKLLDFGIAKLLDPERSPATGDPTVRELRVMTPEYASPEQVRGDTVTTASDVYSLGVLLYELLTGHRPLRLAHLSLSEMERAMAAESPAPPSRAVSGRREIAANRGTRPERLARALAGDLDTILLQALRKEPERRYGSVERLADDLRRHRDGLPVRARPDTWSYRAGKFVGRHRLPVAVAAGMLLVGMLFTLAIVRQSRQLELERDRASASAAEARVVAGFLEEILGTADPLEGMGRETTVAGALEAALPRIGPSFEGQPGMAAAVRQSIGRTLLGLGRLEEAEQQVRLALESRRLLLPGDQLEVAESLNVLGEIRYENDDAEEAERLYEEALGMRRRLLGERHVDVARTVDNLGNIAHDRGDLERAEELYREALGIRRERLGADHREVASSLNNLAVLAHDRGELDRAERLHRESLAMTRRLLGHDHPEVASSLNNLATIAHDRGDLAAAEPLYREAVEIARVGLGPGHPGLIVNLHNLAVLLEDTGRLDEAEALYREASAMADSTYEEDHLDRVDARFALADLLAAQGRWAEAEPLYRQLVGSAERTLPADDPLRLDLILAHGVAAAHLGDWRRSEETMLAAYGVAERLVAENVDPAEAIFLAEMMRDFALRMVELYEVAARPERARAYRAVAERYAAELDG